MTRAVPRRLRLVPVHDAPQMSADRRNLVQLAFGIARTGCFFAIDRDDLAFTTLDAARVLRRGEAIGTSNTDSRDSL